VVSRWIADTDRAVLLAEVDGVPVGLVSLWIRERLGWVAPEAWVGDLVVSAPGRRRGVARALVDACAELARVHGCRQLWLECGFDRADAHAFYASAGFTAAGYDYRLRLEPTKP
jgi:GNAT superfamily N-acetyltransferase